MFNRDGSSCMREYHSTQQDPLRKFLNNYTAGSGSDPLQNALPVAFRNLFESEEPPKNEFSIFYILHPNLGALHVRRFGRTPQDLSWSSGIPTGDESIAQFRRDWDDKEGGAGPVHYDARNVHDIQGIEPKPSALFVVGLKGCDSLRDDPSLYFGPEGEGIVLNEHQEDKALAMDDARVNLRTFSDAATNVERGSVTRVRKDEAGGEA